MRTNVCKHVTVRSIVTYRLFPNIWLLFRNKSLMESLTIKMWVCCQILTNLGGPSHQLQVFEKRLIKYVQLYSIFIHILPENVTSQAPHFFKASSLTFNSIYLYIFHNFGCFLLGYVVCIEILQANNKADRAKTLHYKRCVEYNYFVSENTHTHTHTHTHTQCIKTPS